MKIIELTGYVGWDITAKNLKNRLPKDGSDVLLKIDSVGGSVFEGNRLYNVINDYPGLIEVELGAVAASAASYFPLAAGVENIKVRENTTFMGHKAWTIALGNADDMKAEAEILDGFDTIIAKAYAKANGRPVEDILGEMAAEFWLIGGQAVVDAGYASGIIEDDEVIEDETQNSIIDKSEILARMEEGRQILREQQDQEDLNKWAARIKAEINPQVITPEGQTLLFNEHSAPVQGGNFIITEESMNLKEFLESNPEAKAEFDEKITAAAAEGNAAAIIADRDRGARIMKMAGAELPEHVKAAYVAGMTTDEFAEAELGRRNDVVKKVGDTDMGGLVNTDQTPAEPAAEADTTPAEKTIDKAIDNLLKSKKGGK